MRKIKTGGGERQRDDNRQAGREMERETEKGVRVRDRHLEKGNIRREGQGRAQVTAQGWSLMG